MTEPFIRQGVERYYPNRRDLCICLSGGGLRAAAFHLGVVTWLHKTGLLRCVNEVRSVSGGSIVAAWMYRNADWLFSGAVNATDADFEDRFAGPLRAFLTRDLRTGPILRTVGLNVFSKSPRCSLLAKQIDALLSTVPDRGPVSTCDFKLLAFDVDHQRVVELRPDTRELALQVVASAAFPPLFGPVRLQEGRFVDGGFASNLGVTGSTVNEWRCLLISDASRALPSWARLPRVPITLRIVPLLRDGASRSFRSQIGSANADMLVVGVAPLWIDGWFGSTAASELGDLPNMRRLARLRTDLAGFSPRLIGELEALGENRARALLGESVATWAVRSTTGENQLRPDSEALRATLALLNRSE